MSEARTLCAAIIDALVKQAGDCIFATELSFSGGDRRCDFWTISPNSAAGYKARSYEVKISRADFRRDSHAKQRDARLYSDTFHYVTPVGLLKREEVPDWAGLIEYDDGQLKTVVHAPYRDKDAPTWELVVSLIRNSGQINRDTDLLKQRMHVAERKLKTIEQKLREGGLQPWKFGL